MSCGFQVHCAARRGGRASGGAQAPEDRGHALASRQGKQPLDCLLGRLVPARRCCCSHSWGSFSEQALPHFWERGQDKRRGEWTHSLISDLPHGPLHLVRTV